MPRDAEPASRLGLFSWALYDWAQSAFHTIILTFVFAAYFTREVAPDDLDASRVWGTTVGVAGFLVAVIGPLLGATTDRIGRRKPWLAGLTLLGVAATALLWFVEPDASRVWLGALLVGVGILGIEMAGILYNAMLPSIAPEGRVGRWSGWGFSLGYFGGLVALSTVLAGFVNETYRIFPFDTASAGHVRAGFVFAGGWILLFSLPLVAFTPDTPATGTSLRRGVREGVAQLYDSFRNARRYAHIFRFLIARMVYTDGLATLFAFGGVYAAGTFEMDEEGVLLFGIALNVTTGIGALGFSWVDDRIGSKLTIQLALVGLIVTGVVILAVHSLALFWAGGLALGVFIGPAQAASRSYLARAAPPGLENQLFGLFAFSGKATAFVGPLAVGWVAYLSGSQRIGMTVVVVFWVLGLALLWGVPRAEAAKGSADGGG